MELILLILLILLLCGAAPVFPWSANWGYSPLGLILVILLIVWLVRGGI